MGLALTIRRLVVAVFLAVFAIGLIIELADGEWRIGGRTYEMNRAFTAGWIAGLAMVGVVTYVRARRRRRRRDAAEGR